ncbi:MAG: hypothetical protein FJ137_05735 [Deltaproteobacteria bacterium]|nr:hypothetical protein [Deltaproteobacteria bacterium]
MRPDDQDKSAPAPERVRKIADKLFLGPEFLTWLYFTLLEEGLALPRAELGLPAPTGAMAPDKPASSSGDADGDGDDQDLVQFAIGKRAVLKTVDAGGARVALSGAGLDDNGEILQAIRRGAFLDTLALDMSLGHRVYSFTLRADDGGFVGVKLPDLFSEPEDDDGLQDPLGPPKRKRRPKLPLEDILALRMLCLDELEAVIDALFARFVTRRIARAWHSEDVAGIRKAVARGLKARLVDA